MWPKKEENSSTFSAVQVRLIWVWVGPNELFSFIIVILTIESTKWDTNPWDLKSLLWERNKPLKQQERLAFDKNS